MTGRTSKTWVLLADGEHARVVVPAQAHSQFATALAIDSVAAHKRSHDLGTDQPGRAFESIGTTRHAIAPHEDLHAAAKREFAQEVARQLNQHAAAGDFDRLVLVGPGHVLHDLREALAAATSARIAGFLVKDLVKVPDHALAQHLAEWWHHPPPAA